MPTPSSTRPEPHLERARDHLQRAFTELEEAVLAVDEPRKVKLAEVATQVRRLRDEVAGLCRGH